MDQVTACFAAWRILNAGGQQIVEGIVPPEHRGPSPALAEALAAWPGSYYWPESDHSLLILVRHTAGRRTERWLLHLSLFILTVVSALGAGAALAGRYFPRFGGDLLGSILTSPAFFVDFPRLPLADIISGWSFALPFLAILLVHELGHFFAARRYGIDASPPFFLPIPPSLSPIGSLGAFLRLRSTVMDRRQLLDVGAAGPLAGFVVALAVLVWGYSISTGFPPGNGFPATYVNFASGQLWLGDSLLTHALREHFLPGATSVQLSLPAFAGWAGAFVTGLNLLPLSQLDGGHVAYGLLGRRQTLVAVVTLGGLLYLAWLFPHWLAWVALTLFVGGGRWSHPPVLAPARSVPASRLVVGLACLAVFALTFVPLPFKV